MSNLLLTNGATLKNHGRQTEIAVILEKSIPAGVVMKRSDWSNRSNSRPAVTFSYKLPVWNHVTLPNPLNTEGMKTRLKSYNEEMVKRLHLTSWND
jgi:hypothetical protein